MTAGKGYCELEEGGAGSRIRELLEHNKMVMKRQAAVLSHELSAYCRGTRVWSKGYAEHRSSWASRTLNGLSEE